MFWQGSESVEVQAARSAGPAAQGSTAYLNLETGDCHGDDTSLRALIDSGVRRVVVGLQNPLRHSRGVAIKVCIHHPSSSHTCIPTPLHPHWWITTYDHLN